MVTNLVMIEMPQLAVHITPYDIPSFLHGYTEMELCMLYRNTTGSDPLFAGPSLCAVLAELAERLSVTDVNQIETVRQLERIPVGSEEPHKYVKGSPLPGKPETLFPLTALKNDNEVSVVAAAKVRALQRPAPAPEPVAPAAPVAQLARPRAAPQAGSSAPRTGSVRDTIWKVADSMWEAAGKPTDKSVILPLRKKMMDQLETEYAVKRTSSSNELGNWQKDRIK